MIDKKISVVIPCYNEAQNIHEMHRRLTDVLAGYVRDYELIFVDDGSTDDSRVLFRSLVQNDAHVAALFLSRNFRFSDTVISAGSEYATGDAVIWIEGDIQDPPEMIRTFIEKWRAGYDVIYGVRVKRKGPLLIRVGAKVFYGIFNKFSYIKMPVGAGDFSLLDRKIIDILNKMPERDRFLRGLRAWIGFKQIGVPYVRDARNAGVSAQGAFRYFYIARKGIFSFSYYPLSLITHIAVLSFFLMVVVAIAYLILSVFYPAPRGFMTLLMIVLSIGSLQFLSFAILGEYIGKIFEEVKRRPKYIIEEIVKNE